MIENDYNPTIIEWLETSEIKSWFRIRSSNCVQTTINYQYWKNAIYEYIVVSQPSPFQRACLNDVEWILVGCIPTLIIGIASLVFLGRKAWPFLNLGCHAGGLCPRDDATYARRPSHFVHNIMINMASMFIKTQPLTSPRPPPPPARNTRPRRVRFMDDYSSDDEPLDTNDTTKLHLINEVCEPPGGVLYSLTT
jgi:hypothetical protein